MSEPKFKVGDIVKIANTNRGSTYSAGGYMIGQEFKVDRIERFTDIVYFPKSGSGAFEDELELPRISNWREKLGKL